MKVLVFSATFGNGHVRAAEAVIEAMNSAIPTAEIVHLDFGDSLSRPLNAVMKKTYIEMIKYIPNLYGQFYYRTDKIEPDSLLQRFLNGVGSQEIMKLVYACKPDLIICTYPTIAGVLAQLRMKHILEVPLVTIVTDYAVHTQWIHQGIDLYIVGCQDVCEGFVTRGIERSRIKVTGIPVNPKFEREFDKQALMDKLGLVSDRLTILVMGGAYGVLGGAKKTCNFLGNVEAPVQVLVVCGKDGKMYKSMDTVVKDACNPIRHFGYINNIEELMTIADLILTKAGGLTVTEALTKGLPLLIHKPIPGQEEKNADYIEQIGAGIISYTSGDLEKKMHYLLKHPEQLEKMSQNAQKCIPRLSAYHAVESILTLYQNNISIQQTG